MPRIFSVSVAGAMLLAPGRLISAADAPRVDIYELATGGQVQGEVINLPDTPKDKTVIRTVSGGEVTLENNQIKQIIPRSAAELEYERIRPTYPDTVEGQWKLAEWCRDHSLTAQRQVHLERVIALDPDHKLARGVLGYSFIDGRWIRRDEMMKERGYVKYKGAWMLPQQVALLEEKRTEELAQSGWFAKLKLWRKSADARPDTARDQLLAMTDPAAVPAITSMLNRETERRVKVLLLEALVQLGTADALSTVVNRTLNDDDEEVRFTALDYLAATKHPELVKIYVKALRSTDNTLVNRAAYCLGKLNDKTAIGWLIEALRTRHKVAIEGSGAPGQMSTTFGSGPGGSTGGMSVGGSPKEVKVWFENHQVLAALVDITNVNFEYDQQAWKSWYATQKKPVLIDARRGN